jgi:hypothetical protein
LQEVFAACAPCHGVSSSGEAHQLRVFASGLHIYADSSLRHELVDGRFLLTIRCAARSNLERNYHDVEFCEQFRQCEEHRVITFIEQGFQPRALRTSRLGKLTRTGTSRRCILRVCGDIPITLYHSTVRGCSVAGAGRKNRSEVDLPR